MTPVETLAEAQQLMRERATRGGWVADAESVLSWRPAVALAVADLLGVVAGHSPVADPGKEPWGCLRCGVSDGVGPCDTWLVGLEVARAYLGEAPLEATAGEQ